MLLLVKLLQAWAGRIAGLSPSSHASDIANANIYLIIINTRFAYASYHRAAIFLTRWQLFLRGFYYLSCLLSVSLGKLVLSRRWHWSSFLASVP